MIRLRTTSAVQTALIMVALLGCTTTPPPVPTAATTADPATAATDPVTSCTAPATPTIAQTAGPYFTANSPERSVLVETGMSGTRLTFTGSVVDTTCRPIPGAVVDVWQADANGVYDNAGYRLRGHVSTDADGQFTFETVIPGEYPGRTEHIHVKVTPPGGSTLTTQVYFPGDASNGSDGIFDPSLVLEMTSAGDAYVGVITFVLAGG